MPELKLFNTRRRFLLSAAFMPLVYGCSLRHPAATENVLEVDKTLEALEQRTGGRIGVAGLNLHTGARLSHRFNQRFAMCSTFKWLLAAVVLRRVEQQKETLKRELTWSAKDLVTWSPVTKPLLAQSADGTARLSLGELCLAMMRTSDNTAANLVLQSVEGPRGFTLELRKIGDAVTRLDRWEPELNANTPGDSRDTSTPASMLWLMQELLYGRALSGQSQSKLKGWLIANETGTTRLRAGLPANWVVGDRTGTSMNNANNNIAFAAPSAGLLSAGPLLIVSFSNAPNPASPHANAHHAHVARYLYNTLI